ncbi:MAG: SH3 domain-containing protein [Deltaproteobacteria bacterium]|nr:SH3 domain-containing protein [Deltaproteobacteria bacterium]
MALVLFLVMPQSHGCLVSESQVKVQEAHGSAGREGPHREEKAPHQLLKTLEVVKDGCYVWLKPHEKAYYFGPLEKGDKLVKIDTEQGWLKVWIPRLREAGWVPKGFTGELGILSQDIKNMPEDLLSRVVIQVRRANIREGPSIGTRVITRARKNQDFYVLDEKKGWYQIWLPGLKRTGWISGKIVKKRFGSM